MIFVRWVIVIFATGVGLTAISFYKDQKDEERYDKVIEKLELQSETMDRMQLEKVVMQNEIEVLKRTQIKFNFLEDQYATPQVIKSLSGEVLSVNNAFYKDFLRPFGFEKEDYKGGNDKDFWGEKIAGILAAPENMAIRQERPITVPIKFRNPFDPNTVIDRKWTANPIKDRYGNYIAIEVTVSKEYL